MSLYLWLLLGSVSIPLVLSFDKKVAFYRHWPALFPSLLITALLFIPLDILFAKNMIWGFNPDYHSGIVLLHLPLEEWLFFLVIPYASLFIHFVLQAYLPGAILPAKATRMISAVLIALLLLAVALYPGKVYSLAYFVMTIAVLLISTLWKRELTGRFFISFLVILLPFMLVNGILTGSFIQGEVVWYDSREITGLRIFTIPVEDFAYGFSLLMVNLLCMEFMKGICRKKRS